MIHVGLHSVGTYHKKFGRQNKRNKNILCRVSRVALGKEFFAERQLGDTRQRLTAVSFGTAADGPLPRAPCAECLTLGKHGFTECGPVPSVLRSVKTLVTESRALPSAALGKAVFAECPRKGTRQSGRHSAKARIPVVMCVFPNACAIFSISSVILLIRLSKKNLID
jgi:hypothetical protein